MTFFVFVDSNKIDIFAEIQNDMCMKNSVFFRSMTMGLFLTALIIPSSARTIATNTEEIVSVELVQTSSSVKRQVQGYLDKAWQHYTRKEYTDALKWWRMAAKHNAPAAQYNIGLCYERGTGVKQDMKEAVAWYKKAANQNLPGAQYNLAYCYAEGKGVAQDMKEAAKWWQAAAGQGLAEAQYNLGWCYFHGHGVSQDYDKALEWYRAAAEQGNDDAISALAELGEQ